jgi:hypothetical protein
MVTRFPVEGTTKIPSKKECTDLDFCTVVATHSAEEARDSMSHRADRSGPSGRRAEPRNELLARKKQIQAMTVREKPHRGIEWSCIPFIFLHET